MCGTLRVPGYSLIGGFHIVLTELIYFVSTVHKNNLAHDYWKSVEEYTSVHFTPTTSACVAPIARQYAKLRQGQWSQICVESATRRQLSASSFAQPQVNPANLRCQPPDQRESEIG